MIYALRLPTIVPQMTGATVECLHAMAGDELKMGSKLLDLSIDLSSAFAQECPPISYYRIVLREPIFLRVMAARPGNFIGLNGDIALFSTTSDEPLDAAPTRPPRVTIAGIMHHDGMLRGAEV